MKQEQILEGNKLIAEFMGAKFHELDDGFGNISEVMWFLPGNNPNPHCNAGTYKRLTELEYNIRWDWLMPVVEKISKIEYERQEQDNGIEKWIEIETAYPRTFGMINSQTGNFMFRYNRSFLFEAETLIEAAYLATVDFIKRENEYKNKNNSSK